MAEKLNIHNEEQLFKITDLNNCDTEELKNAHIWHDLRKNPDDLPIEPDIVKNEPENHRYEWFIVAKVGKSMRALYSFAKEKWFADYEEMKIGTNYFEPIAWCDFPQFEEG